MAFSAWRAIARSIPRAVRGPIPDRRATRLGMAAHPQLTEILCLHLGTLARHPADRDEPPDPSPWLATPGGVFRFSFSAYPDDDGTFPSKLLRRATAIAQVTASLRTPGGTASHGRLGPRVNRNAYIVACAGRCGDTRT